MDTVTITRAKYPAGWYEVVVEDQYATWDWARNSYRHWCQENCIGDFSATKIHRDKICARFEDERDALLFILKWA